MDALFREELAMEQPRHCRTCGEQIAPETGRVLCERCLGADPPSCEVCEAPATKSSDWCFCPVHEAIEEADARAFSQFLPGVGEGISPSTPVDPAMPF